VAFRVDQGWSLPNSSTDVVAREVTSATDIPRTSSGRWRAVVIYVEGKPSPSQMRSMTSARVPRPGWPANGPPLSSAVVPSVLRQGPEDLHIRRRRPGTLDDSGSRRPLSAALVAKILEVLSMKFAGGPKPPSSLHQISHFYDDSGGHCCGDNVPRQWPTAASTCHSGTVTAMPAMTALQLQ
jgi:hypothetical protein